MSARGGNVDQPEGAGISDKQHTKTYNTAVVVHRLAFLKFTSKGRFLTTQTAMKTALSHLAWHARVPPCTSTTDVLYHLMVHIAKLDRGTIAADELDGGIGIAMETYGRLRKARSVSP